MQTSFAFCPSCGGSLRNDRQASADRGGSTCRENVTMETLRNSPRKRASSSGMDQSRPEVLPKTKKAELPTFSKFAAKKSEERQGHFKPKTSKHGKHALPTEATINIGLMEYEEGSNVLKLVRGSVKETRSIRLQVFYFYAEGICPCLPRFENLQDPRH